MSLALQLCAVLMLLANLRYGFLSLESLYRPENVVLHQVNFKMPQHAVMRPPHARICCTAVRQSLACGAPVSSNMLSMPKSASAGAT